jgi:hypothetical protein
MTATTTPDGLRYPDDPEAAADSINAFGDLATDTQTALSARMGLAPVTGTLAGHTNYTANGAPQLARWGRLVVARGHYVRNTSSLTVADNGVYQFAVIPVGFRPQIDTLMAGTWQCLNTGLTPDAAQIMTTQIVVAANGQMSVVSNVNGTLRAGTDYVSAGGLMWWTA